MGGEMSHQRGKQVFGQLFASKITSDSNTILNTILKADLSEREFIQSHFPSDVRSIIKQNPGEIRNIFKYIENKLQIPMLVTNEIKIELRTLARLISSFIPVLWEQGNRDIMMEILWNKGVLNEEEESLRQKNPPLIIHMIQILLKLQFLPNFTISDKKLEQSIEKNDIYLGQFDNMFQNLNNQKLNHQLIWRGFLTFCKYPNDQRQFYENRIAILQAIQSCISVTLYLSPFIQGQVEQDKIRITSPNAALLSLFSSPLYPELFVSLITQVFFRQEHNLLSINSLHTIDLELESVCADILIILMCGQVGVYYIKELFWNQDFPDLLAASKHFEGHQFPSIPQIPKNFVVVLFGLISSKLWKAFESDSRIISIFEVQNEIYLQLMIIMTFYLIQMEPEAFINIKPPIMPLYAISTLSSNSIIMQLAFYGLSMLSSIPQILNQLQANINVKISSEDFPVLNGRWTDLIIHSWSLMILNNKKKTINPNQIASIFYNISPVIVNLQPQSVHKLFQLLSYMSSYEYLIPNSQNTQALGHVVGTIYVILQQHLEDNPQLIIELFQNSHLLDVIDNLKFTVSKIQYYCQRFKEFEIDSNLKSIWINEEKQSKRQEDVSQEEEEEEEQKQDPEKLNSEQEQEYINSQSIILQKKIIINRQSLKISTNINNKQLSTSDILNQQWSKFNYRLFKQEIPLRHLLKFVFNLHVILEENGIKDKRLTLDQINKIMGMNNLVGLLDIGFQLRHQEFDKNIGFQIVYKSTWQGLYKKSQCLPYYEKAECIYMNYPL